MYHISGKSVFIPSQLYTLRMANQNLPQEGMPTAPPVTEQDNTEAEQFYLIQWDTLHMNIYVIHLYISNPRPLLCKVFLARTISGSSGPTPRILKVV